MSINIDIETCPRCKKETLYTEFDNKTLEETNFCSECGYTNNFYLKYGKEGFPIKIHKEYPTDKIYLTIKSFENSEVIWEKLLTDINDLSKDTFENFFQFKNICDETLPTGIRTITYKNDNTNEEIYNYSDVIYFNNTSTILVIESFEFEVIKRTGYGIVKLNGKNFENDYLLEEQFTRDEAIKKCKELINENKNIKNLQAICKWFNPETETIEELTI